MTFPQLSILLHDLERKYGKLPPASVLKGGRAPVDVVALAVAALRAGKPSALDVELLVRHLDLVQTYGPGILPALEAALVKKPPNPMSLFRGLCHPGVTSTVRDRFAKVASAQFGLNAAEKAFLNWLQTGGDIRGFVAMVLPAQLQAWLEKRGAQAPWLVRVVAQWIGTANDVEIQVLGPDVLWNWHSHNGFKGLLGCARARDDVRGVRLVGSRTLAVAAGAFANRRDLYKLVRDPIHAEWLALDPVVVRNLRSQRGADLGVPQAMLDLISVAESDLSVDAFLNDLSGFEGAAGERMAFWRREFPLLRQYGVLMQYVGGSVGREGRLVIDLPDGHIAVEFTEGGSFRFFGPMYPGFSLERVRAAAVNSATKTAEFKIDYPRPSEYRIDHHPAWQHKARQRLYSHCRGSA